MEYSTLSFLCVLDNFIFDFIRLCHDAYIKLYRHNHRLKAYISQGGIFHPFSFMGYFGRIFLQGIGSGGIFLCLF